MATGSVHSVVFQSPYRVEVKESSLPRLQSGQLLVATIVTAISPGTEMLFYRGEAPAGLDLDTTIPASTALSMTSISAVGSFTLIPIASTFFGIKLSLTATC